MIKQMVLGVVLAVGTMFGGMELMKDNEVVASEVVGTCTGDVVAADKFNEDGNKLIDIFFMYGNEEGAFFLDSNMKNGENVIFVGYEDLEEWNINYDELSHGNLLQGEFDSSGWELQGLEYK